MTKAELLKTAKPILFNTDMVRAILDGRKTETRRVVKPQPKSRLVYTFAGSPRKIVGTWGYPDKNAWISWGKEYKLPKEITSADRDKRWTPPCHTGDILYVREKWCKLFYVDTAGYTHYDREMYYFAADGAPGIKLVNADGFEEDDQRIRWHPSIHMPKEAARIFLRVTDVRVERLQDITGQGSLNEGVKLCLNDILDGAHPLEPFARLWDSTIPKKDRDIYGWDANPWVWVIEFERIEVEE